MLGKHPHRVAGLWHLVTLLVPMVLVLIALRVLLTPGYLHVAYRLPGFPADPYGFDLDDRLRWAEKARQYLMRPVDIRFLARLRLPDGRPLFNDRELAHLVDVKKVVQAALRTGYLALALLLVLGWWAWRTGQKQAYLRALRRGAWLTLALMGLMTLAVIAAFGVFFVAFHNVFFEPGTWTFATSDTLIRLFPERFWQQAFLIAAGITVALALSILLWTRPGPDNRR